MRKNDISPWSLQASLSTTIVYVVNREDVRKVLEVELQKVDELYPSDGDKVCLLAETIASSQDGRQCIQISDFSNDDAKLFIKYLAKGVNFVVSVMYMMSRCVNDALIKLCDVTVLLIRFSLKRK